jgi:hypothetical protein
MTAGRRTRRKLRGGNFYGFSGSLGGTTAGPQWGAVENVAANSATGRLIPNDGSEMNATKIGGRRRRKTSRKTRGRRRGGVEPLKSSTETPGGPIGTSSTPSAPFMMPTGSPAMGLVSSEQPKSGEFGRAPASNGGKKHRKTKKRSGGAKVAAALTAGRRSRRRSRKMRGGANWVSPAAVGYGYAGKGSAGLADPQAYASKVPPMGAPVQGNDGVYRV